MGRLDAVGVAKTTSTPVTSTLPLQQDSIVGQGSQARQGVPGLDRKIPVCKAGLGTNGVQAAARGDILDKRAEKPKSKGLYHRHRLWPLLELACIKDAPRGRCHLLCSMLSFRAAGTGQQRRLWHRLDYTHHHETSLLQRRTSGNKQHHLFVLLISRKLRGKTNTPTTTYCCISQLVFARQLHPLAASTFCGRWHRAGRGHGRLSHSPARRSQSIEGHSPTYARLRGFPLRTLRKTTLLRQQADHVDAAPSEIPLFAPGELL